MKRLFALALACLLLAGAASAVTYGTVTVSKWAAGNYMPGRLLASGSITFTAVELQADGDSSITTAVVDMTSQTRLAGMYVFSLSWAGCTGGNAASTATSLALLGYSHYGSTDTAGAQTGPSNAILFSNPGIAGTTGAVVPTLAATAAGSVSFTVTASIAGASGAGFMPRYMSFTLDKEGSKGHLTAGTITLSWEAYSR